MFAHKDSVCIIKLWENITVELLYNITNSWFGPETEEGTGEWRELHNEDLRKFYSFNITDVIKSWLWRWRPTAYEEMRSAYRFWSENLNWRDDLGDLSVDGGMTLKFILKNIITSVGADWIHLANSRRLWRAFVNKVMNLRIPLSL
jgi:hypothetical protein